MPDDAVWEHAAVISEFKQVEPIEGAEPGERTEVRLLYDSNGLYVAIHAFERHPEHIRARLQVRDGKQNSDDHVTVVIDPFNTRRDGFVFQINPRGARTDQIIESNRTLIPEWNGIWSGKSSIDAEGWHSEIFIPIKTLNFKGSATSWGFNVTRFIRRQNEEIRWTNVSQEFRLEHVSQIGRIDGLKGLDQGMGLDVKVTGTAGVRDNRVSDKTSLIGDPSLDVFYNITPSLTASLTVKPNFVEAVPDERRVNLTRFNLFFPETRDFFLKDTGIFEFGNLTGSDVNGRPFFTRRIGIVNGGLVDILGGVKLTGRVGRAKIGLLDVETNNNGDVDEKNLFVGRVSYNLLEESSVGVIVTNGDPSTTSGNTVYGTDFRYRTSRILGDQTLDIALWFLKSDTTGIDSDQFAFGINANYPNDKHWVKFVFKEIGDNFRPGLGFVSRTGMREYKPIYRYRLRPSGFLRTMDFWFWNVITTDRDNHIETQKPTFWLSMTSDAGDHLTLAYEDRLEDISNAFPLPGGLTVLPGDYHFPRGRVNLTTSPARLAAFEFEVSCCAFFDGRRLDLKAEMELRPSPYFFFKAAYKRNGIRLRGQHETIHVGEVSVDFNITPDLQWTNLVQYDNVSDNMGINSRLRWIIRPETELFFAINHNVLADDDGLFRQNSDIIVKVGHTFRF